MKRSIVLTIFLSAFIGSASMSEAAAFASVAKQAGEYQGNGLPADESLAIQDGTALETPSDAQAQEMKKKKKKKSKAS